MIKNIKRNSLASLYVIGLVPVLVFLVVSTQLHPVEIEWPAVLFCLFYAIIIYRLLRNIRISHDRDIRDKGRTIDALERELWEMKVRIQDIDRLYGTSYSRPDYFELHMDSYHGLTQSEKELLLCIRDTQVLRTRELARLFSLSEFTMNNRIYHLCEKLEIETRAMLLVYVMDGRFP